MLRRTLVVRALLLCAAGLTMALPASAEASGTSLDFPLELQFQGVGVEPPAFDQGLGLVLEPSAALDIGLGLRLETTVVYDSAAPDEIGVEELLLRREGELLSVWGGMFNPAFGQAWDQDVAVFEGHAASYELTQKLGVGAALQWGDEENAQLRIAGNLFGDATQPSVALSVEAQLIAGLTVNTAVMEVDGQEGFLLGARSEFEVHERIVAPLVELAVIADEILMSMGLSIDEGGMRYTLQNSTRRTNSGDEAIVQATASWTL